MKPSFTMRVFLGLTAKLGFLAVLLLAVLNTPVLETVATAQVVDDITVSSNFEDRAFTLGEKIVITLNRELRSDEGRLAMLIGTADITALAETTPSSITFTPNGVLLREPATTVSVYRVSPAGAWTLLAELPLKLASPAQPEDSPPAPANENGQAGNPDKKTVYEFTPTVAVNVKGQNQTLTFPREGEPERNPFTEVDTQIGLEFKISRRGWTLSNRFDMVGVGFRPNALRFGELQNKAPMLDLSSYLIELSKGKFKVNFGHVSFGSNRHLINSFSSRGVSATIPVGDQNEILLAAMNGTSIVGFDNFIGVTRRKHSVIGAGFAREFFKERPGGLRAEFTVMRGSLLPLSNFNQGEINDAERSLGFGFRVRGSTRSDRLRYEVGTTRSRFLNPADPLLEQGQQVTTIRETWRTARFAEISFDILRDIATWNDKKFKLTGTYRHEEIQPLYRSLAVSLQADKRQNQFEVSGALGEITFTFGNLRDRDNLNELASILKTLNRRSNVVIGVPIGTFLNQTKPNKWLPVLSYTFDRTHQFGAFLPVDGEFRDLSQVPDQKSYVHAFNAQWILSDKFSLGFRRNQAFQDNRQLGRDRADFRSDVSAFTVGTKPHSTFDLDIEFSDETNRNLEQPRTDNTFRIGTRVMWRTPFLKNSSFSGGISLAAAGDAGNLNDSRNAEFDAQWAYRFTLGEKKFKKLETQFFIRYSNRYGSTIDRVFFINGFNKTQSFNFGLSFNIF